MFLSVSELSALGCSVHSGRLGSQRQSDIICVWGGEWGSAAVQDRTGTGIVWNNRKCVLHCKCAASQGPLGFPSELCILPSYAFLHGDSLHRLCSCEREKLQPMCSKAVFSK